MARQYSTGAEWQSTLELNTATANITIDTTKHTGVGSNASYLMSGSLANNGQYGLHTGSLSDVTQSIYFKADMYIDTLPATGKSLSIRPCDVRSASDNALLARTSIYNDSGTLKVVVEWTDMFGDPAYSSVVDLGVGLDEWFRFEVGVFSFYGRAEIRVNGVTKIAVPLSFTGSNMYVTSPYMINSTGSSHTVAVNWDNIALNTGEGSTNNSWIGEETVICLVPAGAGDSNATLGTYASVNEIPPTTTALSPDDHIELDDATTEAWFTVTDPTTVLNSYDQINSAQVYVLGREELAYNPTGTILGIKSQSLGAEDTLDIGRMARTTVQRYVGSVSELDPTTGSRWKVTGDNSIQNAQIGIKSTNYGDIWFTAVMLNVAYSPGTPTPESTSSMLMMF